MMRRIAARRAILLVVLAAPGCENKKNDTLSQIPDSSATNSLPALAPIDSNPSTLSRSMEEQELAASDNDLFAEADTFPSPPASDGSGPRTHVVRRGDTLYSLARRYYDDQRLWRRIHEANQARLQNPNQLPVGMKLIIP